jgi:hypothetical protein
MFYLQLPEYCWFHPDIDFKLRFYEHRAEFEKLVKMVEEDSQKVGVGDGFAFSKSDPSQIQKYPGISQERWNEYRKLLNKVGSSEGLEKYAGTTQIYFNVAVQYLGGQSKGIVYSPTPLSPVLESLDQNPPISLYDDHGSMKVYKPITDHWYIFYYDW